MYRQHDDPSVTRIFLIIIACGLSVWAVVKLAGWFREGFIGGQLASSAGERIARANEFLAQGELDKARDQLKPIVQRLEDPEHTPLALMLMAEIADQSGDAARALQYLERATYDYKTSSQQPEAALRYARGLEKAGQLAEAVAVYRELMDFAPPEWRAAAQVGLGRERERRSDPLGARDLYRSALRDAAWNSPVAEEALDALGAVNIALIFSKEPTPESKVYVVERGDTLVRIGVKLNTTQDLLIRANGIDDAAKVRIGDHLKYTPKEFRLLIERATCRMFLCDTASVFKRYHVGLGRKDSETPLGEFNLDAKVTPTADSAESAGPDATAASSEESDTPQIRLAPMRAGLPGGLEIRGADDTRVIGEYATDGNVFMTRADMEELFALVPRSTTVSIVDTVDSADIIEN